MTISAEDLRTNTDKSLERERDKTDEYFEKLKEVAEETAEIREGAPEILTV